MQPDQSAPSPASTTLSPAATTLSPAARILWTLLILATLGICYFSHLGALGFVGPDEPRYAWIARDMAESGDWITPRLYGKPWFEKPVLYYWGAAAAFKLFGVSETAARLPSAIAALLATLALAWLALRLYGAETARWLLLLLPTSVGMLGFSHAAATDMPFSAMLTIAMVCAAVILGLTNWVPGFPLGNPEIARGSGFVLTPLPSLSEARRNPEPENDHTPILPRTPWLALLLFGFFLGLAVLAKGPAAIIISGGAIFFWALFTYRWRDAFRLLHPVAIAAFCATALPWYILCARRNPDFFRVFIIEHNFKRFLTPEFQHIQPFWFYVPVLLVAFLPWTALLLWSSISGTIHLARTRQIQPHTLFFLTWAAFCVLFFSISQSKLPGYILPALPAIGMLMTRALVAHSSGQSMFFRLTQLAMIILFGFLSGFAFYFPQRSIGTHPNFTKYAAAVLALIALANLFLYLRSAFRADADSRFVGIFCVVPFLLAILMANRIISTYFFWDPSGKSTARELQLRQIPIDRLSVASMDRGMLYSTQFYLHQEIKTWDREHHEEGYLLLEMKCHRQIASFDCEEVPFDVKTTGWLLYKITKSIQIAPSSDGREAH